MITRQPIIHIASLSSVSKIKKMITRRDQLLNKPWAQRRYDNHRRKVYSAYRKVSLFDTTFHHQVQSASAAIDNKPPASRQHVTLKLKKKQKESERIDEIEKHNFILLRRMNYIMRTNRVDNHWTTPQPNFLNRITMYDMTTRQEILLVDDALEDKPVVMTPLNRKQKCTACNPRIGTSPQSPRERVPWEATKVPVSKKRSQSVPPRKVDTYTHLKPTSKSANVKSKMVQQKTVNTKETKHSPQRIVLNRGCLKLSVHFPSDSFVRFEERNRGKILMPGLCNCMSAVNNQLVGKC